MMYILTQEEPTKKVSMKLCEDNNHSLAVWKTKGNYLNMHHFRIYDFHLNAMNWEVVSMRLLFQIRWNDFPEVLGKCRELNAWLVNCDSSTDGDGFSDKIPWRHTEAQKSAELSAKDWN